jgi:outer membrane protein, heavy metal efflux system
VSSGVAPKVEIKRALAARGQANLVLLSLTQQLKYREVALASLWGENQFSFQNVKGDLFNFGSDVDFETLFQKVRSNPMIQVFADQQRLIDAELRLVKTQSSADIGWSIGFRQTQETNDTSIVAGFSMPLISASRNRGAVTSANAKRNQTYVAKEVALVNIHKQLYRAFYNRQQAILTVSQLKEEIIPQLEQAMKGIMFAYQQGRYGYLDTVSARQQLLSAKRSLIEAATAALRYGAEIEQLTAEPLAASQYGQPNDFTGIKR